MFWPNPSSLCFLYYHSIYPLIQVIFIRTFCSSAFWALATMILILCRHETVIFSITRKMYVYSAMVAYIVVASAILHLPELLDLI